MRSPSFAAVPFALLVLAGCTTSGGPMQDLAAAGGPPQPTPAPDFVARSRPANLDYLPVGTAAPVRTERARTAEEVNAAEAELEATRSRNEAQGAAARRISASPKPAQP